MLAAGSPTPIRPVTGGRLSFGSTLGTPQAIVVGDNVSQFAVLSTNVGSGLGSFFFRLGNSTVALATGAMGMVSRDTGPVLLNVSGYTHIVGESSGGGQVLLHQVDIGKGTSDMLRSPPQLSGTSGAIDISSLGSAAIPSNGAGEPPKYVMFSTTSVPAIRLAVGDSTVTAAASGIFYLTAAAGPVIVNVAGSGFFAWDASPGASIVAAALEF